MAEDDVDLEEVVPPECRPSDTVELRNVWVLSAVPIQKCHSVIQAMKTLVPMPNELHHLKRCRYRGERCPPQIILGCDAEIPEAFMEFLTELQIERSIEAVSVPAKPPYTRQQYLCALKHWPVLYKRTEWEPLSLTQEQKLKMIAYLRKAIDVGNHVGTLKSGCIIVFGSHIAGIAGDRVASHPLHHAAIVAIEDIASRQRSAEIMGTSKIAESTGCNVTLFKQPSQNSSSSDVIESSTLLTKTSNGCLPSNSLANVSEYNISKSAEESDILGVQLPAYLCTDTHVYLSHEPCIMCSMALLHSRVSVVVYDKRNERHGGLGSQFCLHTLSKLNHKFRVFRTNRTALKIES